MNHNFNIAVIFFPLPFYDCNTVLHRYLWLPSRMLLILLSSCIVEELTRSFYEQVPVVNNLFQHSGSDFSLFEFNWT